MYIYRQDFFLCSVASGAHKLTLHTHLMLANCQFLEWHARVICCANMQHIKLNVVRNSKFIIKHIDSLVYEIEFATRIFLNGLTIPLNYILLKIFYFFLKFSSFTPFKKWFMHIVILCSFKVGFGKNHPLKPSNNNNVHIRFVYWQRSRIDRFSRAMILLFGKIICRSTQGKSD